MRVLSCFGGIDGFNGLRVVEPFPVEGFKKATDRNNGIALKPGAFHADLINGAADRGVAVCNEVRRHVLYYFRGGTEHGVVPYPTKLVHPDAPADVHVIADFNMTAERGMTAHDEVVADVALVSDVAVGEDEVVIAETGQEFLGSRAVNRHVFAEDVVIADFNALNPAPEFFIVGFSADVGIGMHLVLLAHLRGAVDCSVVHYNRTRTELHLRPDVGVGPDGDPLGEFSPGLDDGGGMDFSGHGARSSVGVGEHEHEFGFGCDLAADLAGSNCGGNFPGTDLG